MNQKKRASVCRFNLLLLILFGALSACHTTKVVEERYPSGGPKLRQCFLVMQDSTLLRHGLQISWYPNGRKESVEMYEFGALQGYAIHFYSNGKYQTLEHYANGVKDNDSKFWDEQGKLIGCLTPDGLDCSAIGETLYSESAAHPENKHR